MVTSNVEAMFVRHGFESERVWTPQGDFAHMHCTARRRPACAELVWSSEPVLKRMLQHLDSTTQEIDASGLPRCPACGGSVFFNVREDATFVESPYIGQAERCVEWIRSAMDTPLLILEIGAGFTTPGVVRWPLERLARKRPHARFVRMNREHAEVPLQLGTRALGIGGDAGPIVQALVRAVAGTPHAVRP